MLGPSRPRDTVGTESGVDDSSDVSTQSVSESGTLFRARGREWVMLPDSKDELLTLRRAPARGWP